MTQTIVCTGCGSKIAATRERCPKCRAHVVMANPAAGAARSRPLAWGSGIFFGGCALTLGLLWFTQDSRLTASNREKPAVPEAARRGQPIATDAAAAAEADLQKQRAFMEPPDLGAQSYSSGDYEGALTQFEAAVARNPNDAESISNLGQVLVKLGRTEEAIPHFQRACALNQERWAYRFNLARAHGLLRQWDESIASYRLAQRLFPDDYVTTFNLALTLHKKGDETAAVEEYRKAVALNPEEASFRMALGISYEALQRNQDAAAAYSEYLRLAPTAEDAEKVRARIMSLTGQTAGL